MIPDEQIKTVLSRVDLTALIGEHVELRRSGASFEGLCPFHEEKSPSFKVFADHFHCYGCGAHGNAVEFLMGTTHVRFPDAIRALASRVGVDLTAGARSDPQENSALSDALRTAVGEYQRQLMHAGDNPGQAELRRRGIDSETVIRFGIGYAPDEWDFLLRLPAFRGKAKVLEAAGLVTPRTSGKGFYDRFRSRLMFPVMDHGGKPVGFGGRHVGGAGNAPKYLNTPETVLYRKSRVLFGVPQAAPAIRATGKVIVVEGYFDVIVPWQHGVENVVSTCGTALTEQHARVLLDLADQIVICFDGDPAGRSAMWRAARLLIPLVTDRHQLQFCTLPQEHDPDSFVRERTAEAFAALVDASPTMCAYLVSAVCDVGPSPEARSRALRLGVEIFGEMRLAHALRAMFRAALCKRLEITEPVFSAVAHPRGTEGLAACHHCGGPASVQDARGVCLACGAAGPRRDTPADAAAAWNTRA
jgi:DNA primase